MLVGFNGNDIYFASSDTPIIGKATEVYYLEDGEYGYAKEGELKLFDANGEKSFTKQALTADKVSSTKRWLPFLSWKKKFTNKVNVMTDTMIGTST